MASLHPIPPLSKGPEYPVMYSVAKDPEILTGQQFRNTNKLNFYFVFYIFSASL